LGNDRYGHDLQAMQNARWYALAPAGKAQSKEDEDDGGWQSESRPGCQCSTESGAHPAYRHTDLTTGWPREKLTERHQIEVAMFAEPTPVGHELVTKVSQVGNGTAERGQAKTQENNEYVPGTGFVSR
jgi:hypothetical protein